MRPVLRAANAARPLHRTDADGRLELFMANASPDLPPSAPVVSPLVLVAEDHEDNLRIAVTILQHAGFRTAEARTGLEAIECARTQRPAMVLMDIGLPIMDGWTAARTLRGDPDTAQIILVACTAHALEEDESRAALSGCDAYITKPISPKKLLDTVRALLPPS
jgi:two-component system, cell cycle response regulator DivK